MIIIVAAILGIIVFSLLVRVHDLLWMRFATLFPCQQVIAAITYQIIPADTQYAEVPLAAVNSIFQRKVLFLCRLPT